MLQVLTEPALLYQIVQLLLTYDPSIVQRVATLLHMVMQVYGSGTVVTGYGRIQVGGGYGRAE